MVKHTSTTTNKDKRIKKNNSKRERREEKISRERNTQGSSISHGKFSPLITLGYENAGEVYAS